MKYLSLVTFSRSIFLVVTFLAASAQAQWAIDAGNSSVDIISMKNNSVAESHSFDALNGSISADGSANVVIELDSVNTLIEIRNERVRKMLFETANFPLANITAKVDAAILQKVIDGGKAITLTIPLSVALHGKEKAINAAVVLAPTADGGLVLVTSRPILIRAADFDLENGIELLRKVAGLNSISSTVPVSFSLAFVLKG